jgi:hypothetical protein
MQVWDGSNSIWFLVWYWRISDIGSCMVNSAVSYKTLNAETGGGEGPFLQITCYKHIMLQSLWVEGTSRDVRSHPLSWCTTLSALYFRWKNGACFRAGKAKLKKVAENRLLLQKRSRMGWNNAEFLCLQRNGNFWRRITTIITYRIHF